MPDKPQVKEKAADFIVTVYYREDTSMQGRVEHLRSGQVRHFRSFLELVMLVQAKLEETGHPQSADALRSWKDDAPLFHSGAGR
jgi:hypothetical protein